MSDLQPKPAVSAGPVRGPNLFVRYWRKVGGGSLMLSLLIHGGVMLLAGAIYVSVIVVEKPVDFLPGGGTKAGEQASQTVASQVRQNRRSLLKQATPMRKVVSQSTTAAIALPDIPMETMDLPEASSLLGGRMGSGGFGSAGAGGGFGKGVGIGGMSGVAFKPVIMFGRELNSRKIAVVMDVSRSMTRYLPAVARELDKIASQSVLVLYFGCGLAEPRKDTKINDEVLPTAGEPFARFWQNWEGKTSLKLTPEEREKLTYDAAKPMPLEDIYKKMTGRRNTYFVDFNGIQYAWTALMCKEVMEADTIYWFADFMDKVDESKMDEVRRKLKYRKQKLVMHASARGKSFEKVRDGLALPLGGEVVEAEVKQ